MGERKRKGAVMVMVRERWLWSVLVVVLCAGMVVASPAWGSDREAGSTAGEFLTLDPSARSAGMGSAMVARSGDLASLAYNPSSLAGLRTREVYFTHNDIYVGIAYDHVSVGLPGTPESNGAWGLSVTQVDYGNFERTEIGGENPIRDLGNFEASDRALGLSYARSLTERMRVGLTGRYIRGSIETSDASTLSLDVGMQYESQVEGVTLGLSGRNLVGELSFEEDADPLPRLVEGGLYYRTAVSGSHEVQGGVTVVGREYGRTYMTLGVEYGVEELHLRMGYHGRRDVSRGFTFGGGLRLGRTTVDYAYVPFADLDAQQRLSLSFLF